jgi:hypothetical protein
MKDEMAKIEFVIYGPPEEGAPFLAVRIDVPCPIDCMALEPRL